MAVVYFLQVQPFGPIKIGSTKGDVWSRVKALQQSSPHELKWIGFTPGGQAEEFALHKRFSHIRIRAEWFHPAPDLLAAIGEICPGFDPDAALNVIFFEAERLAVRKVIPRYSRNRYDAASALSGGEVYRLWKWLDRRQAPDAAFVAQVMERAKPYLQEAA
jgi:hypothetical protein